MNNEDTQNYHSLIGYLQWDIYLGRFDICTHVITMYRFIYAPHQSHMGHMQRIYEYLDKMSNACIWV